MKAPQKNHNQIRYAVVGLGAIAQLAVLPAFKHARRNYVLTALVSDDPIKLKTLGNKYRVPNRYAYDQYDECLTSGLIDAVYIALPNSMHADFTVRAANAGIHVLCEKPMATDHRECEVMTNACHANNVRLMIAYRLHFEAANLEASRLINQGRIGDPRIFNSTFSRQLEKDDIRLKDNLGGGSMWDLGIYYLNAARYLFKDEPTHVTALCGYGQDRRFSEVDEMTAAVLRFPKDRIANFTSSFGAAPTSSYEVVGTKGVLRMDPGYDYSKPLKWIVTTGEKQQTRRFPRRDQFAPELMYFSDCVLSGKTPEPSGAEGTIDVKIIEAIYESAKSGRTIALERFSKPTRPTPQLKITAPPVQKPKLVHASK